MELKPDLTYLKEMSSGDKNLMIEVLDIYLEQVPEFIGDFREALHAHDYIKVSSIAHKAKTSVAIAGFNELSLVFKKIELISKDNDAHNEVDILMTEVFNILLQTEKIIQKVKETL
ncbi:MAG: hypothetical protein CVU05_07885 [Bacteroidetes bacterium HGW-Bacteroidetes-21]|jgi:HPt (histidine-containing phosphotransfer) domain-containing protein|nr:MAG: hypothetical protein CVU05_07885 [Bacteroidetes bacterium HGW-Bacteroidetes-21]